MVALEILVIMTLAAIGGMVRVAARLSLVVPTIVAQMKKEQPHCVDISSLLYRNYYQLKYSWNFLKKVKWLSDIRQPFFDLLR